jgi:hypothetical protein
MWYFAKNNERQGPMEAEELRALVMQGQIAPGTLVWKQGMAQWEPIESTEFQDLLPPAPPPLVSGSSMTRVSDPATSTSFEDDLSSDHYNSDSLSYELSPRQQIQQLESWFKICWLSIAIGAPLTFLIVGFGGLITGAVFGYMILFKCWKTIQDGRPRTTPGKAVGFMFIPFFNLYWQFVAFLGLAKDMNRYMKTRKIRSALINEEIALWYCILTCASGLLAFFLPLAILVSIASFVLWILLLKSLKNAAIAILRSRAA